MSWVCRVLRGPLGLLEPLGQRAWQDRQAPRVLPEEWGPLALRVPLVRQALLELLGGSVRLALLALLGRRDRLGLRVVWEPPDLSEPRGQRELRGRRGRLAQRVRLA